MLLKCFLPNGGHFSRERWCLPRVGTLHFSGRRIMSNHGQLDGLFVWPYITKNGKISHKWPFVRGIHRWPAWVALFVRNSSVTNGFPSQSVSSKESVLCWHVYTISSFYFNDATPLFDENCSDTLMLLILYAFQRILLGNRCWYNIPNGIRKYKLFLNCFIHKNIWENRLEVHIIFYLIMVLGICSTEIFVNLKCLTVLNHHPQLYKKNINKFHGNKLNISITATHNNTTILQYVYPPNFVHCSKFVIFVVDYTGRWFSANLQ